MKREFVDAARAVFISTSQNELRFEFEGREYVLPISPKFDPGKGGVAPSWRVEVESEGEKCFFYGFGGEFGPHAKKLRRGEPSRRAIAYVRAHYPDVFGEKGDAATAVSKVGASEFPADKARLGEHEGLLGIGKSAVQAVVNREAGGWMGGLSPEVSHLLQLVARRRVVEAVLVDWDAGKGEVRKRAHYVETAKEAVRPMWAYLVCETEEMPEFPFRVFPEWDVKADPVIVFPVGESKLRLDRKDLVVLPLKGRGKKTNAPPAWSVPVFFAGYIGTQNRGWHQDTDREAVGTPPIAVSAILLALDEHFPKGVREEW